MNNIVKHLKKSLNMLEKHFKTYAIELFILLIIVIIFLLKRYNLEHFFVRKSLEQEVVEKSCGL